MGHVSQIDGHEREPTGLQHEIERLDRTIDDTVDRPFITAHPEQPIEIDARRRC